MTTGATAATASQKALAARILDALPHTQCTRCSYADCAAYAQAIAQGEAGINQCPPGGAEGVARLAAITGQPVQALNAQFGTEGPRSVVFIDEDWCIGCTLCIKACPVDAIVGQHKRMHTVIENQCTGCELCLPVCPVDCIYVENATPGRSGWAAWSPAQAATAREDYARTQAQRARDATLHAERQHTHAQEKLQDLSAHSTLTDPATLAHKRQVIEAAMERARAKRAGQTTP